MKYKIKYINSHTFYIDQFGKREWKRRVDFKNPLLTLTVKEFITIAHTTKKIR